MELALLLPARTVTTIWQNPNYAWGEPANDASFWSASAISAWARMVLYLASCVSLHLFTKHSPIAAYRKPTTRRTMAAKAMKFRLTAERLSPPGCIWVGEERKEFGGREDA